MSNIMKYSKNKRVDVPDKAPPRDLVNDKNVNDKNVNRWHQKLLKGSQGTADEYLRWSISSKLVISVRTIDVSRYLLRPHTSTDQSTEYCCDSTYPDSPCQRPCKLPQ